MEAYVEAADGDIVLKLKKFLVEGCGPHNFFYKFSDTVGEVHGLDRRKSVIVLITGEVPEPPETGNDILLDSDDKFGCSILYLILTMMLRMGHK